MAYRNNSDVTQGMSDSDTEASTEYNICPECGYKNDAEVRFCRRCCSDLDAEEFSPSRKLRLGEFRNQFGCAFKFLAIIVILIISVPIAAYFMKQRELKGNASDCFAFQRILYGAIEMYNMDNSATIKQCNDDTIRILRSKNYLRTLPNSNCSYYSVGDLTESGTIGCRLHGKSR